MHIILIHTRDGHDYRCPVRLPAIAAAVAGTLVLALLVGWLARGWQDDYVDAELAQAWEQTLETQARELERLRKDSRDSLGALTRRFAQLQARLVRMEAVGSRVVSAANLDPDEFEFGAPPALGGPDAGESVDVAPPAFMELVEELSDDIVARQQQLDVLQTVIDDQAFLEDTSLSGRPVQRGWMSSSFGRRVDPFSGKLAWHDGVDFAGREGSQVTAVAAGVVVAAGPRAGYGRLVELNHGNGYVTRYGHNEALLVEVGDVVRKGDVIARMGSTGRSTGPHVHFEVVKDGRPVDPARYVRR